MEERASVLPVASPRGGSIVRSPRRRRERMVRLDDKLARIRAGGYRRTDFIIADAKDPDMGPGLHAVGPARQKDGSATRLRTREEFLQSIEAIVRQDVIDVILTSVSNLEQLVKRNAFAHSGVKPVIHLGLYSITFTNDVDADLASLEAFRQFRADAEEHGFSYFLEVFNPNVEKALDAEFVPHFVNDAIVRCLAGLTEAERPRFLK